MIGLLAQSEPAQRVRLVDALENLAATEALSFGYNRTALDTITVRRHHNSGALTWPELRAVLESRGCAVEASEGGQILISLSSKRPYAIPTVRLTVIDEVGDAMPGVYLLSEGTFAGVTDEGGGISVPLDVWQSGVEFRHIGMQAIRLPPGTPLPTGGKLQMQTAAEVFSPVVVYGRLPPKPLRTLVAEANDGRNLVTTALHLPAEDLTGFGFTGVAGASRLDARSSVPALRGSTASETAVSLDGLPVYHLDHFFGLFPAVDPSLVRSVTLHRSHYPSYWGASTGGLMAIATQDPTKPTAELTASQLFAGAKVGYASDRVRVLGGLRSSYGTLGSESLLAAASEEPTSGEGRPTGITRPGFSFIDGYTKAQVNLSRRWRFVGKYFGSTDAYDFSYAQGGPLGGGQSQRSFLSTFEEATAWDNRAGSLSIERSLDKGRMSLTYHRSAYMQELQATGRTVITNRRGQRQTAAFANTLNNEVVDRQWSLAVTGFALARVTVNYGLQFQRLRTVALFGFGERRPLDLTSDDEWLHAYGEATWKVSERLELSPGLRLSRRIADAQVEPSPRLQLGYALSETFGLTAGYSRNYQNLRTLQHENQYGQTYNLLVVDPPVADAAEASVQNLTLGTRAKWRGVSLDVEAYYRDLRGVLAALSAQVSLPQNAELVNLQPSFRSVAGRGEVLGVDTDLRYVRGDLSGQLAYTLSRSRRSFATIDRGAWQRAPDDRRHRLATSHRYAFGKWTADLAYEAASGLTYVDLNVLEEEAAAREQLAAEEYLRVLPAYHRVDLGIVRRFGVSAKGELDLGLRLYNVLDRANVTQRQYTVAVGNGQGRGRLVAVGTDVALLGRILLVEAKLAF